MSLAFVETPVISQIWTSRAENEDWIGSVTGVFTAIDSVSPLSSSLVTRPIDPERVKPWLPSPGPKPPT